MNTPETDAVMMNPMRDGNDLPNLCRSLEVQRDALQARVKRLEEAGEACHAALGYPWFKDDQKNFPGSTEDDGVFVGEHVAETIVAELASKYAEANERIKKLELELEKAWRMYHKAAGKI